MSKWAWCLVQDDDKLAVGWHSAGDYWYYFYSNGSMATGWIQDESKKWYYLNENGQMQTGWYKGTSGNWYYLIEKTDVNKAEYKGQMVCDCTREINGKSYTFDEDGVWIESTSLLSDAGAEFIGSWEGLYLKAYEDPYYPGNKNWWTIGYGTTYAVRPDAFPNGLNSTCTKEQAIQWLKDEAKNCAEIIKSNLDSKELSLNQNQLDALISFAYNCGAGALLGSTLYKNIIAGVKDGNTIRSNFQVWSKANGQTSQGLLRRRNAESDLFLNGDYAGNC